MSHQVVIKNAVKIYGDYKAVNNANLTIKEGELFTLLGPSGCGKTTLLRMIAGFNSIDGGHISFGDKIINDIPAHKRNIGMVFQNYAIFPHMSVFNNVAYGLKARKIHKDEINKRVMEALEMVQMAQFKDRQPSQLSGGQQQRIALARAIVIHPDVLLMDEPLSNLDAKLRVQMRTIIRKLQKDLKITTIYVTHDQEEALAISDRIAVMKLGVIQQVGTPVEIYKDPQNTFIGDFIGTSNYLKGKVIEKDSNGTRININNKVINMKLKNDYSGEVIVGARPEEIIIADAKKDELNGEIVIGTFLGDFINYEIRLTNDQIIEVNEYTKDVSHIRKSGDKVSLILSTDRIHIYDSTGEEVLL
ncbi:ABC transporter ATP-binding protein [Vallitalea guaymasensis]|uniref:Spermidine/putrescine import ATP-binding protein PotA n=1 Tax=Vallitalea guaymasensis TaxID=1185412 RepID=A0A8J8MAD9_9FIRM|nr:ABC transporter ATP-binding protein [Vallitalea guaymasensis]QUH29060.1 ABC transporter ATP-binding protein [Vallitalea guaymasensis]